MNWVNQNKNSNLAANGYASDNIILNLGGFAVVIFMFFVGVVFFLLVGALNKCCCSNSRVYGIYKKVYYKIFWGMILTTIIHSYLKITISATIQIKNSDTLSPSGMIIMVFFCIGFPAFIF
jgi:hypothetical protein